MRLPRFVLSVRKDRIASMGLLCALVLVLTLSARTARAQEAAPGTQPAAPAGDQPAAPAGDQPSTEPSTEPGAPAPAAAPKPPPTLRASVEDYWHYAKVARYDLANASGQQV